MARTEMLKLYKRITVSNSISFPTTNIGITIIIRPTSSLNTENEKFLWY